MLYVGRLVSGFGVGVRLSHPCELSDAFQTQTLGKKRMLRAGAGRLDVDTPVYLRKRTSCYPWRLDRIVSALYCHRNYGLVLDQLRVGQAVLILPDLP